MTQEEKMALLAEMTEEELKAEIRRRIEVRKETLAAKRAGKVQCRNCKYYGTIDRYGKSVNKKDLRPWSNHCCPNAEYKRGGYYRALTGYEEGCEKFERE